MVSSFSAIPPGRLSPDSYCLTVEALVFCFVSLFSEARFITEKITVPEQRIYL